MQGQTTRFNLVRQLLPVDKHALRLDMAPAVPVWTTLRVAHMPKLRRMLDHRVFTLQA